MALCGSTNSMLQFLRCASTLTRFLYRATRLQGRGGRQPRQIGWGWAAAVQSFRGYMVESACVTDRMVALSRESPKLSAQDERRNMYLYAVHE
jgi:hypothetical protein